MMPKRFKIADESFKKALKSFDRSSYSPLSLKNFATICQNDLLGYIKELEDELKLAKDVRQ